MERKLLWAFMIVPFFVYMGVAGQAMGLYLFGIIVPCLLFSRWRDPDHSLAKTFQWIALALLVMWLLFPCTNILALHFLGREDISSWLPSDALSGVKVWRSQLSSTVLATSLLLFFMSKYLLRSPLGVEPPVQTVANGIDVRIWQLFVWGFVGAATLFGSYFVVQYWTGFAPQRAGHSLPISHLINEHHYRILGFYGHPLSMAGVALTLTSFFTVLALFSRHEPNSRRTALFYLAAINFLFLVGSGGRTALLIGTLFVLVAALFFLFWQQSKKRLLIVGGALGVVVLLGVAVTVNSERFYALFQDIMAGNLLTHNDRFTFWWVHSKMFFASPIFGQGAELLAAGVREAYYYALGFAKLHDKYNAHNIYLEILADSGILGAGILLSMLFVCWRGLKELSRRSPRLTLFFWAFISAIFCNLLHGVTQNVFFDAAVIAVYMFLLWIFIWLAMATRPAKPPTSPQ